MLRPIKRHAISAAKRVGLFDTARESDWRRNRLLILCYHGISQDDEHLWDSGLYMPRDHFARRMETLKRESYNVLPLPEALKLLDAGDLPPRSVAITFDDGAVDFHRQALPVLESFGYPATVYLTTFYSEFNYPIFRLVCSYMIAKSRERRISFPEISERALLLSSSVSRARTMDAISRYAAENHLGAGDKNRLASELASRLGIDFQAILKRRILHLMNPGEIREISRRGVDVQLHTHRHRVPSSRSGFQREITQNSSLIADWTGEEPVHFCYPDGRSGAAFLPWMRELGIQSAVTCRPGLASRAHNRLLLPRVVDTYTLPAEEFESWLCGVSAFLPLARNTATPPNVDARIVRQPAEPAIALEDTAPPRPGRRIATHSS